MRRLRGEGQRRRGKGQVFERLPDQENAEGLLAFEWSAESPIIVNRSVRIVCNKALHGMLQSGRSKCRLTFASADYSLNLWGYALVATWVRRRAMWLPYKFRRRSVEDFRHACADSECNFGVQHNFQFAESTPISLFGLRAWPKSGGEYVQDQKIIEAQVTEFKCP
jgi:hypothetical protein